MAKNNNATGQIRIIAGQWRSRRLPILDLTGLRPTTDRVRETVFNWLAGEITGSRVLDCFAGSGALTFESLSRYAAYARAFELQPKAAKQLQKNLALLKCQTADIITGDSIKLLAQGLITSSTQHDPHPQTGFDIVFIDPPFRQNLASQAIAALSEQNWLNHDALIYVETEVELGHLVVPKNWTELKCKKAGQVCYRLFRYEPVILSE